MIVNIILYILMGSGLIFLGWKVISLIRKGHDRNSKINELEKVISETPNSEDLKKLQDKVHYYEDLCDHRIGLWSEELTIPGSSFKRNFDIEVIMVDTCESKAKIRIIEAIDTGSRVSDYERKIAKRWDGQWVQMEKIKELSNSRVLSREKRFSKLLDNKD